MAPGANARALRTAGDGVLPEWCDALLRGPIIGFTTSTDHACAIQRAESTFPPCSGGFDICITGESGTGGLLRFGAVVAGRRAALRAELRPASLT